MHYDSPIFESTDLESGDLSKKIIEYYVVSWFNSAPYVNDWCYFSRYSTLKEAEQAAIACQINHKCKVRINMLSHNISTYFGHPLKVYE